MRAMRVALVYDRVNKWGGAERVLLALHSIWPAAPLYTAVYDKKKATWADVFTVKPSFLQNLPHELLPWITPLAFETFNFEGFDVVISVTSAEAKNIITKPGTLHICYCLTPTRYLWSAKKTYESLGVMGYALRIMSPMLKKWDLVASARPDYYIAISDTIKKRIKQYYQKDADVIYPPVDVKKFTYREPENYFLVVSRLVAYKRVDVVIDAFNALGWPLVVIGEGQQKKQLMRRAKKNITFLGQVTDAELISQYAHCRAFVHAGVEDFGIAAVEAQASGKPVVAYKEGGITEIVPSGQTGLLFQKQTASSLTAALASFDKQLYDSNSCKENAQRFSIHKFQQNMKLAVERIYNNHI